eukprot:128966-Pleurochrysis_carterae.AAC.1
MEGEEVGVEHHAGPASSSSAAITAPAVTAATSRPRRVHQRVERQHTWELFGMLRVSKPHIV